MINPDSKYYNRNDIYNPKNTIGHIAFIKYNKSNFHTNINVNWTNGQYNIYKYSDLLIKI